MTFFTFDGCDYHLFDTEDQALKCAQEALDSDEEWSEEVEKILVGVVTHVVTEASVVLRDDLDEEGCFDGRYYHGDYDRGSITCSRENVTQIRSRHFVSVIKYPTPNEATYRHWGEVYLGPQWNGCREWVGELPTVK